jgi:DNA-binding GntR family transcriptional regulator
MAAANRDHVEVIDKLASGDADGAIAVLREHLEGNTEVLRSIRDGGAAVRKPRRPRAAKRPARRKTPS